MVDLERFRFQYENWRHVQRPEDHRWTGSDSQSVSVSSRPALVHKELNWCGIMRGIVDRSQSRANSCTLVSESMKRLNSFDLKFCAFFSTDIVFGIEAVFGAHSLIRHESTQIRKKVHESQMLMHPEYNPKNLMNDIALVKVRRLSL